MILCDFQSPYPGVAEYILIVWTFSLFMEEVRQVCQRIICDHYQLPNCI